MAIIFFIFGLIVGSFLNAVIWRLHARLNIAFDRSVCPHCKHVLSALDLVPVLSFVILRGRCRYCSKKISWQYPAVELFTGLVFVLLATTYNLQPTNFELWFKLIFACFFIVIAVYDFKHYLILDKVLFPAIGLALLWSVVNGQLVNGLIGALIISGFFALQYFVSRGRWIGFGDVKLGVFLGLLFGPSMGAMMLFVSYCLGAMIGLILVAFGKKEISGRLPFGTILGFSAIIMMIIGKTVLAWYLKLIGF